MPAGLGRRSVANVAYPCRPSTLPTQPHYGTALAKVTSTMGRMKSRASQSVATALVLCAAVAHGGQPESGDPATSEALALCREADHVSDADRPAVLARGLERAEEAVRTDPRDAAAHFAVFCNLGKRLAMKRRGGGMFGLLGEL